jgi:hypothetical protein
LLVFSSCNVVPIAKHGDQDQDTIFQLSNGWSQACCIMQWLSQRLGLVSNLKFRMRLERGQSASLFRNNRGGINLSFNLRVILYSTRCPTNVLHYLPSVDRSSQSAAIGYSYVSDPRSSVCVRAVTFTYVTRNSTPLILMLKDICQLPLQSVVVGSWTNDAINQGSRAHS